MGIPIGSVLHFAENDSSAVVVGDKKVRLNDEEMSLTSATRQLLGIEYNVQPTGYWSFDGKLLKDIYEETYSVD